MGDTEIEIDKELDITVSKDTARQTDIRQVLEDWNQLSLYGIKQVSKLLPETKRYKYLMALLEKYGMDDVLAAIEIIKKCDFLCGKNKDGWTITFDWFVVEDNYIKVAEGNYEVYANRTSGSVSSDWMRRWLSDDEDDISVNDVDNSIL